MVSTHPPSHALIHLSIDPRFLLETRRTERLKSMSIAHPKPLTHPIPQFLLETRRTERQKSTKNGPKTNPPDTKNRSKNPLMTAKPQNRLIFNPKTPPQTPNLWVQGQILAGQVKLVLRIPLGFSVSRGGAGVLSKKPKNRPKIDQKTSKFAF